MEIIINTSKCHECTKQWNGNSHISSLKLTGSHFIVILFTTQCQGSDPKSKLYITNFEAIQCYHSYCSNNS